MFRTLILLCASLFSTTILGAVLIESVDDQGEHTRVLIDDGRARIDAGSMGGYMLINLEDGNAYAVNHSERAVLDLHSPLPGSDLHIAEHTGSPAPLPVINFNMIGKGPVIAGYQTTHYKVDIDGRHCFDEYLSEQLLATPNVKRFIEIISKSTDTYSDMEAAFEADTPCKSADALVDDYYPKLGIPMRTIDSNGKVSHEITRVDTGIEPPAGTFTSPPGYKKVTRSELVKRSKDQLSAHPDIGNLDNEEIKKMQEQIKAQIDAMNKRRQQNSLHEGDMNTDVAPVNK